MKAVYALVSPHVRSNAARAVMEAPENWLVEIKPRNRSLEQNALLHELLGQISNAMKWAGQSQDIETWKRLLTAAWCRARGEPTVILPAVDGQGVDIVFRRTSELNVTEMSELIEYIQAWMVDHELPV
jgi:hypothetical protein